jgi:hypothetical protein
LKEGAESLTGSTPLELFPVPIRPGGVIRRFQAARDGRRFLVLTGKEPASQLPMVVSNRPALLKQERLSARFPRRWRATAAV